MPWTLSVALLSLWLLGMTIPLTLHGYIHILLVLAVVVGLFPLLRRLKVSPDND
jgi:hypothetical protein